MWQAGPRSAGVVLLVVGLIGLTVAGRRGGTTPLPPPPIPDSHLSIESLHSFVPVDKGWSCKVAYLVPDRRWDPPHSMTVIAPKDRDPGFKGYYKEERYVAKGKKDRDCKILWYSPDGTLSSEIDNLDGEQFSRSFHPGGGVGSYVHWREGLWLGGYSVSPDGRSVHRLGRGDGELVFYGKDPANYQHFWYAGGRNVLSRQYQGGSFVPFRLNDGDEWLIAEKTRESLWLPSAQESWDREAGERPSLHRLDRPPIDPGWHRNRAAEPDLAQQYRERRSAFLVRYGAALKKAGLSWEN